MIAQDRPEASTPVLVTLDPPRPPSDIIQSALFIPLSQVGSEHKGRKIRTIGQVLSFDAKSGILLLAAVSEKPLGSLPTLLVNISTPLLGMTPAMRDLISMEDIIYFRDSPPRNSTSRSATGRREQVLKLDRGEFVSVVGWMEGDGRKLASRVHRDATYQSPMAVVLEAIFVANARPPPREAINGGDHDFSPHEPPT